jgi:hypothetical protein
MYTPTITTYQPLSKYLNDLLLSLSADLPPFSILSCTNMWLVVGVL